MNLFELTLGLKRFPISEAKKRLQAIQAIKETDYSAYILQLRKDIFDYHYLHNSSYKKFLSKNNYNPHNSSWEEIPIINKSDLQQPLQQRLSSGYNSKNCYVNKTSGSSGHPFVFAKDRFSHALTWAIIINRYSWYGLDFAQDLQARFYGIPLEKKGYYKERIKDFFSRRYRFPIFDLSDEKMELFLNKFRKKKFTYINGYTSSIVLFAKYLKERDVILKNVCPTLKYCIVTSEMLFEKDKHLLEQVFGIPIVNEYGASELDLIAFTNKQGQFQINSESIFVEVVDNDGKAVSQGQEGRIVITSLYNRAQAMIRYDIGDLGILDEKSTIKVPILKNLIGRTNDLAYLPNGKKVPGLTFYYVTKSVIEDDGNVKEFVIEQHRLDSFKIIYTAKQSLTTEEKENVQKALDKYVEIGLILEFERVEVLDRSNRGKLKQFIQLLKIKL